MTSVLGRSGDAAAPVAGTVGGVHHLASVVADAEAAAAFQERAFGWRRLSDELYDGDKAALLGSVLGLPDATRFRTIMVEADVSGNPGARVEFIDLETPDGAGSVVAPGLHVASYRVRDAEIAWTDLIAAGAEPVRSLVDFDVAGWVMRVGTVRLAERSLIEVIQYLGS